MKISHFVFLAIPLLLTGMWTDSAFAQENASLFNENVPREFPYTETFTISAYYSPLPDQTWYVTGSYEGDITLNGDGVLSADNTEVYPGMIAAPSQYPFGMKIGIPGLGIGAVHDRGGAIKSKEDTGQSYDRLDVWMGHGDMGLERALAWGKRTLEVTVYGKDDTLAENFYLENFSEENALIQKYLPFLQPKTFKNDIWYGSEGEKVTLLQKYLQDLGFFQANINGFYGNETRNAVFQFQKSKGIVEGEDDLGAGHFGIRTRLALERAISELGVNIAPNRERLQTFESYDDLREKGYSFEQPLQKGDSGENIRTLQEELKRLGYLRITPTGIFGEITEHAVFKLQQAWGLIADISTPGAGTVGPNTRSRLNAILGTRIESKRRIALKRNERMLALNAPSETVRVNPSNHDSSHITLREPLRQSSGQAQGDIATDLGLGDRGIEVETLQKTLKSLGFFTGLTSEYFGSATASAVLNFQLQYDIIEDVSHPAAGYVGPKTREMLNELAQKNDLA
ncbi:peptidoglycan-binding protein [Candidatus Peregrinibacteria bacterium]|nr:peptidoglycan-binding protein [Candidatus Peregrinibacteria bacterium]